MRQDKKEHHRLSDQSELNTLFEMDPETIRALGYQIIDMVVNELAEPSRRPIAPQAQSREALEALFGGPLPQAGTTPEELLKTIQEGLPPAIWNINHPNMMGYVLSSPLPLSSLIEALVSVLKPAPSYWSIKPGPAHIEATVVRWLGEMVGFSSNAAGTLTTGGSWANLVGLTVARARKAGWDVRADGLASHPALVAYASQEGHSSLDKAIEQLGIGRKQLRKIPVDSEYRIRLDLLEEAIKNDRAAGYQPFCLIGMAGTVNTGAVDPLDGLADIAAREDMWLHLDGAYGAFATLDPSIRPLFTGLERADSLVLDPHKWLNVPYEAGCILVRDWADLADTFSRSAAYLRAAAGEHHNFANYGLELGRADRAIKVWLALRQYGVERYARLIAHHMALTRYLASWVEEADDFEIISKPVLSICCFRYVPPDLREQTGQKETYLNALNEALETALADDGRALVSGTELDGKRVLRACIVSHRNTKAGVEETLMILRELGRKLDKQMRESTFTNTC